MTTVILLLIFIPIQNKQSLSQLGASSPYEIQIQSPQMQSQAGEDALKLAGAPPDSLGGSHKAYLALLLKEHHSLRNRRPPTPATASGASPAQVRQGAAALAATAAGASQL